MSLNLINILRSGLGNLSLLALREAPPGSCFPPSSQTETLLGSSTAGYNCRVHLDSRNRLQSEGCGLAPPGLHNLSFDRLSRGSFVFMFIFPTCFLKIKFIFTSSKQTISMATVGYSPRDSTLSFTVVVVSSP